MIEPGTAIERPGEGGYFAALYPAADGTDEGSASSAGGTDSSTSSPRAATNTEPGRTASRKPARTTASR